MAQPNYLPFKHLSQSEGLLQQDNLYFFRDSKGYIWISSVSGLNRYNGVQVTTFTPDVDEPCAIRGHNITSPFFEDEDQNIWFSTYEGLHCWDRKQDCFLYYPIKDKSGKNIVADNLLFARDNKGLLWLLIGGNDIYTYDPKEKKQQQVVNVKTNRCFAGYQKGTLRYIFFYDTGLGQLAIYGVDSTSIIEKKYATAQQLHIRQKEPEIRSVWYDGEDIVWLATDKGLVKMNLKEPSKNEIFHLPVPQNIDPGIFSIFRLSGNQLLVGSFTSGLYIFNDSINKYTHRYTSENGVNGKLAGNEIRNIYIDDHANIWLALFRGEVNFVNIDKNKFDLLFTKNELPVAGDNVIITRLLEGKDQKIWIGTQNDGLFSIDKKGRIRQFKNNDTEEVFQLFFDQKGNIWSIKGRGVLGYYHSTEDCWVDVNKDSDYPMDFLYSGLYTSSGELLLGRYDGGLYSAVLNNDKLVAHKMDTHVVSKTYTYLFEASDNRVYAGYNWEKIEVFIKQNGKWIFQLELDIKGIIHSITENRRRDTLYIATSYGLVCLNTTTDTFKTLTVADGLPDQNVQAVLEDDKGDIWFSTKRGIVHYTPGKGKFKIFSISDGLQGLEFMPAACQLSNGAFLFGGVNGANRFFPEKIKYITAPPPIEITAITINDTVWQRPACLATGARNVNELKSIRLRYNQNTIGFSFVGIDYSDAQRVSYRYYMENYDNPGDTTHTGNSGFAKYTKLPHGAYVFHIYATNADGAGESHRALQIEILPPFWKTWWFYTLEIFAGLFLLWGAIRLYVGEKLRKVRIQQEKQAALQRERDRIASEMHDDLGAGLSTIRLMSERIQHGLADHTKKEQINRITQHAGELIEKMATIIWAMNSSHDTIEGLFGYLRRYTAEYLETHDLQYHFPIPQNLPHHVLTGDKRRHIFLAFKEALHNIVKHARATSVHLALSCDDSLLVLTIADDGVGIPADKPLGNGLGNMAKRLSVIGGSCHWEANTPRGTIVKFQIPLE